MIGQKKLLKKIDSYSLNSFPHSVLFTGDKGSEINDICDYISAKFNLPLYDITELISDEYINEINSMATLGLYFIDCTKITEREQNILLKFYEEPTAYTYIILYCESKYNILETIKTRSYEFLMEHYSKQELLPLIINNDVDLVFELANTPGTIEELNHVDIKGLSILCNNIIDKISVASYQNTLTIANKINFKDEYDKYPLWAFIRMLEKIALEKESALYWEIESLNKKIWPLLDKKRCLENMLTNMWLESRRS